MKSSTTAARKLRDLLGRRLTAHRALPLERDAPAQETGEVPRELGNVEIALMRMRLEDVLEDRVRLRGADLVVVLADLGRARRLVENEPAQRLCAVRRDDAENRLGDHHERGAQLHAAQRRVEPMQAAAVLDELAADDGLEQLLLAAEVAVDRLLRDTRAARHRVDARAAVTVLEKVLRRDVEHLLLLGLRLEAAFVEHAHEARDAAQASRRVLRLRGGGELPWDPLLNSSSLLLHLDEHAHGLELRVHLYSHTAVLAAQP